MKNLLLFTVFVCSVFFADAQFTTGEKLIGGQFSISYNNTKPSAPGTGNQTFQVGFSPSFSRFKSPTLMTGAGFVYSYYRYRSNIGSPLERVQPNHLFGLFVNRTKLETLAKRFYFTYTGTAGATYETSRSYYISGIFDNRRENYGVYLSSGIGLLYELNQRFLLSFDLSNLFSINYSHSKETGSSGPNTTYKNSSDGIALSTNLANFNLNSVGIGVKYRLKK